MRAEDRDSILALIDKMKALAGAELERATADLKTVVMMAAEPEMEWVDQHPVILSHGGRTYRAVELRSGAASG